MNVSKFLLKLFTVAALVFGAHAYALDTTITKTASPGSITLMSNGGFGLAQINLLSSDFPSGTQGLRKILQGITWSTTSYPQNVGEKVQLCYFRPFASSPVGCTDILPSSSGTLPAYNGETFGNGARVVITHRVLAGGSQVGHPTGTDSVTFRYSN